MEESTISVIITLAFSDATTRNIRFNGVEKTEEFYSMADKVKALNANMPPAFANTFVSAMGAPCTMISKLQSVETTEEVIYRAN